MSYPLGHEATEAARLDAQAELLRDPTLEAAARAATRVLEVGCGTGSNYPIVRAANPRIEYHGIDFAPEAIEVARRSYDAKFDVGDATKLPFGDESFDLVFFKLVLWSIPNWHRALTEARRVLKPGGVLHLFELDDKFVTFEPPRPALEKRIAEWDAHALAAGLDPFIGRKLAGTLTSLGFSDVRATFQPRLALAGEPAYAEVLRNLHDFYFGASAERFGLAEDATAKKEAARLDAHGLVMDSFFTASCKSPGYRRYRGT